MLISKGIIIMGALFSIIYTTGVVWRVEKKLDLAYKLFLLAIISFTASEIVIFFEFSRPALSSVLSICLRVAFVVFFLAGTLEMRNMIRRLDGEK
jgi:hypothetical protein